MDDPKNGGAEQRPERPAESLISLEEAIERAVKRDFPQLLADSALSKAAEIKRQHDFLFGSQKQVSKAMDYGMATAKRILEPWLALDERPPASEYLASLSPADRVDLANAWVLIDGSLGREFETRDTRVLRRARSSGGRRPKRRKAIEALIQEKLAQGWQGGWKALWDHFHAQHTETCPKSVELEGQFYEVFGGPDPREEGQPKKLWQQTPNDLGQPMRRLALAETTFRDYFSRIKKLL